MSRPPLDLGGLEGLNRDATPAPWRWWKGADADSMGRTPDDPPESMGVPPYHLVTFGSFGDCALHGSENEAHPDTEVHVGYNFRSGFADYEMADACNDAALVVAMRNALPALLAALRSERERRESAEAALCNAAEAPTETDAASAASDHFARYGGDKGE